jgi:hypothetical protein
VVPVEGEGLSVDDHPISTKHAVAVVAATIGVVIVVLLAMLLVTR